MLPVAGGGTLSTRVPALACVLVATTMMPVSAAGQPLGPEGSGSRQAVRHRDSQADTSCAKVVEVHPIGTRAPAREKTTKIVRQPTHVYAVKGQKERRGRDSNPRDGLTPPTRFPIAIGSSYAVLIRPTIPPIYGDLSATWSNSRPTRPGPYRPGCSTVAVRRRSNKQVGISLRPIRSSSAPPASRIGLWIGGPG